MKRKKNPSEVAFNVINYTFLSLICLTFVLPIWLIAMASFTPEVDIIKNGYSIFPKHLSLEAYNFIFTTNNNIFSSARVSVIITLAGTAISLIVTTMYAYAISRPKLPFKRFFTIILIFTMLFNGGLIPTYLVMRDLNLLNTIWVLILMNVLNPFNMIIIRNYFMSLPQSIEEAARLDGAGMFMVFWRIMLPLSKPVLATITLFYAVSLWNDWVTPMYYITQSKGLTPLQLLLQRMLTHVDQVLAKEASFQSVKLVPIESLRSATVIVATLPIILTYPFLQKYFVRGSLLGAIKE